MALADASRPVRREVRRLSSVSDPGPLLSFRAE